MSMPGLDAVGAPVVGQISRAGATAIVPVITAYLQEMPQLRGLKDQGRKIALIASGETRTILPIIPSYGWFANLSTPTTRPKLPARHQQVAAFWPFPAIQIGWFNELSKPQKLQKKGVEPRLQQALALVVPLPGAATLLQGWYNWYSEPVRFKRALRANYQQSWIGPTRLLPTPNVTATMSAFEVNTDSALMAVRIFPYNPPASATVSVVEIGDDGSATAVVEV